VTARALALEDRRAPARVAGPGRACCRRSRLEDLRLRERERPDDDRATDEDRPPAPAQQKPNFTVVKYQRLDVSQRIPNIEARVSPTVGSAQPGSE
jgi:hypothetical protein